MNNGIALTNDDFYFVEKNTVCIDFSDDVDNDRAKELKQQILNNHAIVEKIQNEITKEPRAYILASYLQKVIDTTYHSLK